MSTYRCTGFRNLEADHFWEAAERFADRAARREYGRRGYRRTLRLDNWAENGTSQTFEAFVGVAVRGDPGTTSGHNVWLTVHRIGAP